MIVAGFELLFDRAVVVPGVESNGVVSIVDVCRVLGLDEVVVRRLGVLWGKSAGKAGGRVNLLVSHMLDTAAVAGLMWDSFLAQATRAMIDRVSGGDGRRFFMWLCAIHDCGKATPSFQDLDADGAARTRAQGLGWTSARLKTKRWRHDKAGGKLIHDLLKPQWTKSHVDWVWPLVAGHHGAFGSVSDLNSGPAKGEHQGRGADWRVAQQAVVQVVTAALGYRDVAHVCPATTPAKADQLCLSGLIVMADWIASDSKYFGGIDQLAGVSMDGAQKRALRAWRELKLRGGWRTLPKQDDDDLVARRFGVPGRASQLQLQEIARTMPGPGLLVVEAPMGEGKTKGVLAAAEILAARFGANGVFMGMPSQATCDPMFTQMRQWLNTFDEGLEEQVALLHGRRRFNPEWKSLWNDDDDDVDRFDSIDIDDDPYGMSYCDESSRERLSQWFLGPKRGLLAPFVVGTIDQLLFAATRTRHVMLRFVGLAGKVVILDEVHAIDIHMRQFLVEALRWLGQARVPVVMLSATLPQEQRRVLTQAYLSGAQDDARFTVRDMPQPRGYPSVTQACVVDGHASISCHDTTAWRKPQEVSVAWLPDISIQGEPVVAKAYEEVADGGVALVVVNQVARAQAIYTSLHRRLPGQVRLLHGSLDAGDRATRTNACLQALGPDRGRPERLVVVATQLAEQSFDVDADVLITDIAPIDLLLQRVGRLHRHLSTSRPPQLRYPKVWVTGIAAGDGSPQFLGASEYIYGRFLLLRSAAVVRQIAHELGTTDQGQWSIPFQVPQLVAEVYGDADICPPAWRDDERREQTLWEQDQNLRAHRAEPFLLCKRGMWAAPTLEGLHVTGMGRQDDLDLEAAVRDGDPSVEVVMVHRTESGFSSRRGASLGIHGEASEHVEDEVLAGTIRLPKKLTEAAISQLRPLDGWAHHPWLKHAPALVFDHNGYAILDDHSVRYHPELGLVY